jgi:hypothetical protein
MIKAWFFPTARAVKIVLILSFILWAAPASALACACCAEPGEWYEHTGRMENHEFEELRRIRFGESARVYLTAAGFEGLKGLPVNYAAFTLTNFFNRGNSMTLTLKGERGEAGSLTLSLPKVVTSFGADLRDYPEGSAGPILYKEWRFKGAVGGSGIFKRNLARGTKFRLILQGRGNNCAAAEDFKNWRLEIEGPRASYAFYGSLKNPG